MTRSDVFCTNCRGSFIAELDLALTGNHEITCPLCGHIHYRVVLNGEVTEDRYRSSAGPTYFATTSTTVSITTANTASTMWSSWLNVSTLNTVTTP